MKKLIPFFIAGLLIGLFLTLQFKSEVLNVSSYPLDEYEFQLELVQSFMDDQTALEEQLNTLNQQVEEAEERISSPLSSMHASYLQSLKDTLGLSEVSGQGIEIILDDNPNVDRNEVIVDPSSLIHASDLRDLINLLRTFPNSGIAINGQRIVASTAILSAGNSLLINNFHVAPPFEIRMITDVPVLVLQKLSIEEELPSVYSRAQSNGLEFKFKEESYLTLPAHISGYSTEHINLEQE